MITKLTDFYAGEYKRVRVELTYNGKAPDIANDGINFMMKSAKTATDTNADIDTGLDVVTEGFDGVAILELSAAETATLTPGQYYYELKWTKSSGEVHIIQSGTVAVMTLLSGV